MWVIFALLDPDSEYGSGSTDLIESGSNPVPDPKPWYKLILFSCVPKIYHIWIETVSDADPDPHHFGKLDPDPPRSGKQDPDPLQSEKMEAFRW